jgi:hypothetical protein
MAIPTVSGSAVVAAPVGAAPLNAEALMGPGRGMQSIAQGLSDVSDVAKQFADRKQNAINAASAANAQMQMEKAANDYQIEMSHMVDDPGPDGKTAEEKWTPGWDDKSSKLKGSLLADPKISRAVKDHLEVTLSNQIGQTSQQIATQANTRTIQRQKAKLTNVAEYMYQNGAKEKGDIAIDAMAEHGLIFPEEAYRLKEKGHEAADFQTVNKAINQDPFGALDALQEQDKKGDWTNFTDLDENKREALKVEATRATSAIRHETVNGLMDRINQGEIIGKDELQSLVDQRHLKATEMKWVLQQQKNAGGVSAENTAKFAEILTSIDNYDPLKDPTHQKRAELFGQALQFPTQYRDEIKRELEKRLKPETRTAAEHNMMDVRTYIGELRHGGLFGDTTLENGKPHRPKEYQAAFQTELELRSALKSFVAENPKADILEQRDFINKKVSTLKTVRAAMPVLNAISGRSPDSAAAPSLTTVKTKAERDALAPGARYLGPDGKTYTRGN